MTAPDERYRRGLAVLEKLDPEHGERLVAGLAATAPDFAGHVVAFAFGDICGRPGLDLRTRELATVAALTALGTAPAQLEVHVRGALNVGATREEIVEVITQMAVYAGFPAALNGLAVARRVFEARPHGSRST
ncbi:MAG: carboxymuconolactone decarboxylase family protein [Alphaproteobacteria bacterium]